MTRKTLRNSGPGRSLGDDPAVPPVDPLPAVVWGEALLGSEPDVRRGGVAEGGGVALQGAAVPVVVLGGLGGAALGGAVVEGAAEGLPAELGPITVGVNEVQVPGLVHLLRGGDGVAGGHGQVGKTAVLLHDAQRVGEAPAMVPGEALGKGETRVGVIQAEGGDFEPKGVFQGIHDSEVT